jgi:hypothetical protein
MSENLEYFNDTMNIFCVGALIFEDRIYLNRTGVLCNQPSSTSILCKIHILYCDKIALNGTIDRLVTEHSLGMYGRSIIVQCVAASHR